jgi:acetyl esterase
MNMAERLPVMLYFHGGGFTISHNNDSDYDETARRLAKLGGWIVVSAEYPLAPENPFPAALSHCHALASWVAFDALTHSALARADPERLLVGGDSAGGNLAAVVSMLARDGRDALGKVARKFKILHQV